MASPRGSTANSQKSPSKEQELPSWEVRRMPRMLLQRLLAHSSEAAPWNSTRGPRRSERMHGHLHLSPNYLLDTLGIASSWPCAKRVVFELLASIVGESSHQCCCPHYQRFLRLLIHEILWPAELSCHNNSV